MLNTFFVLFSCKKLAYRAGIYKILVKQANREDRGQTASKLGLCHVCLGRFGVQVVFKILEHLP